MIHEWVLLWLPIVLASGLGGRLLGRGRGAALGILCGLFWIVLVQAREGAVAWQGGWNVAALLTGALAITAVGAWGGDVRVMTGGSRGAGGSFSERVSPGSLLSSGCSSVGALSALTRAMETFDDWLEAHRNDPDPWPGFGEFARGVLYDCCRTSHVRFYRILSEGAELAPIREGHPFVEDEMPSAREGIVGHVATTGRSYLEGDATHGALVDDLARRSGQPLAWCFAVTQGARKIGLVTVGGFDGHERQDLQHYRAAELLIAHFWMTLLEVCRGRSAATHDPVSGALTREAFFTQAERSLDAAKRDGEPCALAVLSIEPLRQFNDAGDWDAADEVVRTVSHVVRERLRGDDRFGRFDEGRMMLLLRRVDSSLASLILEQLLERVRGACAEARTSGTEVQVRCGVVGSGTGQPRFSDMLRQAVSLCQEARLSGAVLASDLHSREEALAGGAAI
ncbi:MAG: hypothetical protein FLDDKLPJ_02436 [Phycisphaerae bacterium]|nr:hypothetical protein [Phycisphaerae bacterium]